MSHRLTSEFWISAYKHYLDSIGITLFITNKGDDKAGAILIRVSNLKGSSVLFSQGIDIDGKKIWEQLARGCDSEMDKIILRQIQYDPDIWVLEIEEKSGNHFLEDFSISY